MYRNLIAILILLLPATLFAQKNDIGIFLSSASYSGATVTDPDSGTQVAVDFDRGSGVGLSYNRFWTPSISTEFGYMKTSSEMNARLSDGADESTQKIGDAHFWVYSAIAQWHFRKFGNFAPYAGAGIAAIDGTVDVPGFVYDTETSFFTSSTTWIATAGVVYAVNPRVGISVDARYVPYTIEDVDDEPIDPQIDLNPLVVSAGLHFTW